MFYKIKELADNRKMSLNEVEDAIGLGKNYLYSLKNKTPKVDNLKLIADYFDVTTDYLLDRNVKPEWATKQQVLDVEKALRDNDVDIMYDGIELSDIEKAQIKQIIRTVLWDKIAERENKK